MSSILEQARRVLEDEKRRDRIYESSSEPRISNYISDEEVCPHLTGKGCDYPLERVQVAAVVDVAQRAFEASGEPTVLSADLEVLDGVEHVRIITAPCSVLLPLSAARIVFGSLIPRPSPDALVAAREEGWNAAIEAAEAAMRQVSTTI